MWNRHSLRKQNKKTPAPTHNFYASSGIDDHDGGFAIYSGTENDDGSLEIKNLTYQSSGIRNQESFSRIQQLENGNLLAFWAGPTLNSYSVYAINPNQMGYTESFRQNYALDYPANNFWENVFSIASLNNTAMWMAPSSYGTSLTQPPHSDFWKVYYANNITTTGLGVVNTLVQSPQNTTGTLKTYERFVDMSPNGKLAYTSISAWNGNYCTNNLTGFRLVNKETWNISWLVPQVMIIPTQRLHSSSFHNFSWDSGLFLFSNNGQNGSNIVGVIDRYGVMLTTHATVNISYPMRHPYVQQFGNQYTNYRIWSLEPTVTLWNYNDRSKKYSPWFSRTGRTSVLQNTSNRLWVNGILDYRGNIVYDNEYTPYATDRITMTGNAERPFLAGRVMYVSYNEDSEPPVPYYTYYLVKGDTTVDWLVNYSDGNTNRMQRVISKIDPVFCFDYHSVLDKHIIVKQDWEYMKSDKAPRDKLSDNSLNEPMFSYTPYTSNSFILCAEDNEKWVIFRDWWYDVYNNQTLESSNNLNPDYLVAPCITPDLSYVYIKSLIGSTITQNRIWYNIGDFDTMCTSYTNLYTAKWQIIESREHWDLNEVVVSTTLPENVSLLIYHNDGNCIFAFTNTMIYKLDKDTLSVIKTYNHSSSYNWGMLVKRDVKNGVYLIWGSTFRPDKPDQMKGGLQNFNSRSACPIYFNTY